MHRKTLQRIQQNVREGKYVMTRHAKLEMDADGFSISDIERGILNGKIVERQKEHSLSEWKYRIRGKSNEDQIIEIMAKFNFQNDAVIITVYSIK